MEDNKLMGTVTVSDRAVMQIASSSKRKKHCGSIHKKDKIRRFS